MKEFLEKHAQKVGGVGTIIPVIYWLLIWQKMRKTPHFAGGGLAQINVGGHEIINPV